MRFATRLVGAWILVGAYMKLFHGTPADLPSQVRDLPLAIGLTFKLVIAIEIAIGLFALLRPSSGWLPALALLLAFAAVLVLQIKDGAISCGCMGKLFDVDPKVMLGIDGGLAALLMLSAPWREQLNQAQVPFRVVALLALLCAGLPWLFDRQATGDGAPSGKKWVALDKETDVGRIFITTPVGRSVPKKAQIQDGLIVFYRNSCEDCRDHLMALSVTETGDRRIVMLRLPDDPDEEDHEVVVESKPIGDDLLLPGTSDNWAITPPSDVLLRGGKVIEIRYPGDLKR